MRQLRPQFAILAGAFALAVLVSLFASTSAFYQELSLATEFDCVARLFAELPVEPLVVTGLGTGGPGFVIVDP